MTGHRYAIVVWNTGAETYTLPGRLDPEGTKLSWIGSRMHLTLGADTRIVRTFATQAEMEAAR